MKIDEKKLALKLRIEDQLSIKSIAKKIGVAKSTVSLWVRDYPLSRERIRELSIHTQSIGAAANKESARKRKQLNNDIGNELVVTCHKFRDLCLLYWGEGCKTESHKYFSISNSIH